MGRQVSSWVPSAEIRTRNSAAKAPDFDNGGHDAGDRGGGSLVHVRGPGVKGHGRHLEGEAHQQQTATGVQQTRVQHDVLTQEVGDAREIGRSRRAIDQRGAVDEDRRGEAAQQEVLERSLVRGRTVSIETDQHVKPDGENLQPEEDDDQVVGLNHQQRTRTGGQRQDVKVSPGDALAPRPVVSHEGRQQHRASDGHVAHHRETVQHHGVRHAGRRSVVGDVVPLEEGVDDDRD